MIPLKVSLKNHPTVSTSFQKPPKGFIRRDRYRDMHACLALPCVDILLHINYHYFLLIRRFEEPKRGEYWFPGGRVWKGETRRQACVSHLMMDTGLSSSVDDYVELGSDETMFAKDPFEHGYGTHTINTIYAISFEKLNGQVHHPWFTTEEMTDPYLQRWSQRVGGL